MTAAVELRGLGKRYGDVVALHPLTLSLPTHSIVGVLGPNGAGKTTAFKLMLGLTGPSMGEGRG